MLTRNESLAVPHIGGGLAVAIFVFTLLAFVLESQLAQYVQTTLGYRQPFFIFYLVHSSFSLIFPLHLLYLIATTQYSASAILKGLSIAITKHLTPRDSPLPRRFPRYDFLRLAIALTVGITYPGLLWFAAISLASVSDVTAIWNTNAFFAYLISVQAFRLRWEPRKLLAVSLATLGTIAVVYGGASTDDKSKRNSGDSLARDSVAAAPKPTAPLLGNLLTLIASFGYGLYQVLYKLYAALPTDPEVTTDILYEQILDEDGELHSQEDLNFASSREALYPPPFGLHPNLLTSIIGCCTCLLLWIPLPILHISGAEHFRLPPTGLTVLSIAGIAFGGMIFNAGFMVLLGVWGPIITSVGGLLTIVLMMISDIIFGSGLQSITAWSLVGSSVIVVAFGILAYDMFTKRV